MKVIINNKNFRILVAEVGFKPTISRL